MQIQVGSPAPVCLFHHPFTSAQPRCWTLTVASLPCMAVRPVILASLGGVPMLLSAGEPLCHESEPWLPRMPRIVEPALVLVLASTAARSVFTQPGNDHGENFANPGSPPPRCIGQRPVEIPRLHFQLKHSAKLSFGVVLSPLPPKGTGVPMDAAQTSHRTPSRRYFWLLNA
jgi:hypothetical protein